MYGDEQAKTASDAPESMQKIKMVEALLRKLEGSLSHVLRPDNELAKNTSATPEMPKSELMYGLQELEYKAQSILNRLHV